jgi:hypothetical protein
MKVILLVVIPAIAVLGLIFYQSANTKAPPSKYKWGQQPPTIGFTKAPKGMTDKQILEHNQQVLRQAK